MDVFLRWWPQNFLRKDLACALVERLVLYEGVHIRLIQPDHLQLATFHHSKALTVPEPFHITSKLYAEQNSQSPIYCVIDDDQLPISDDFFAQGEKAMTENPEYGMLAGFPLEYGLHGQPYADRTEDVIEAHSIGCPYFVRKGTLSFPDGPLRQYDGILSKVVTDQGLKTGFARRCLYNHLGYGFSQVEHAD